MLHSSQFSPPQMDALQAVVSPLLQSSGHGSGAGNFPVSEHSANLYTGYT